MVTKKERDETEYYSLLNVVNGNILSAALNPIPWNKQYSVEKCERPRNWKLSQFQVQNTEVLTYFVESEKIDNRYSMGIYEIWVKEEDIDELYKALAISCINNFCGS